LKLSTSHDGSLSSSGSEFQTVGPATGKARRPYVLSRQRATATRAPCIMYNEYRVVEEVEAGARIAEPVRRLHVTTAGRRVHHLDTQRSSYWVALTVLPVRPLVCPSVTYGLL